MNKPFTHETTLIADGVGKLTQNLESRGLALGGKAANRLLAGEATSPFNREAQVKQCFTEAGQNLSRGFYGKHITPHNVAEMNALLAGHVVLLPQPNQHGNMEIFPAVVSPEGLATPERMKITAITNNTYNPRGITPDQHFHLSAIAQSETKGIGLHRNERPDPTAIDPEHLIAVYGVSRSTSLTESWQQGHHPNHNDRQTSTVISSATKRGMFASRYIDQSVVPATETVTLQAYATQDAPMLSVHTSQKVTATPNFTILWHENLVDPELQPLKGDATLDIAGQPHNALQVVQGVGYMSLTENATAWYNTQQLTEHL
ncbi:MAG TPA: hypothetical protein VJR27_03475 [Candidatus Saccharimonadales bacterium]|nr:hypothetical protein [Candidatus Saccharimonadales bacterium]